MRNSYRWLLLAGLVIATMTVGCHKMNGVPVNPAGTPADPDSYTIWAGDADNQFAVGRLDVWEEGITAPATLHVKYVITEPNWFLTRCQLAVAVELESIPQKSGNPIPRDFKWDSGTLGNSTEYEFTVPFETGWDVGKVLHVAAHCELVKVVTGSRDQAALGWGGTEPFPGRKWALYCLYAIGDETPSGLAFRTVTQGGWGALPEPGNWGQYLRDHFDEVFGVELRVGHGKYLLLSSAPKTTDYLPDFGVPTKLSKTRRDPPENLSVFAGQVVALFINVQFDLAFADFAPAMTNLKDLYVADPTSPFHGWTVQQVVDEANRVLGGYGSYTPGIMNVCVTRINENHEDLGDNGFLSLTPP